MKVLAFILLLSFSLASEVNIASIGATLAEQINAKLEGQYSKVQVSVLPHPKVSFPDKDYQVNINLPEQLLGMTVIPVDIDSQKNHLSLQFQANIKVYKNVVVAAKALNQKSVIAKEAVALQEKDVTNLILAKKTFLENVEEAADLRAKTFLKEGEILTSEKTEKIPDVLLNAMLTMIAQKSSIVIKLPVKALEEGCIGDTIKVINTKYNKIVLAKITKSNEVLLVD